MLGSSGSRSNPLGALSIVTELAAALASAVLWIYRVHPESLSSGGTRPSWRGAVSSHSS